jgi:hypothetical protein
MLLGMLAVLVAASPAAAHRTEVSGTAVCQPDGTYEITKLVARPQTPIYGIKGAARSAPTPTATVRKAW